MIIVMVVNRDENISTNEHLLEPTGPFHCTTGAFYFIWKLFVTNISS